MRADPFQLFGIDDDEFQNLASHICLDILGTGAVVFAPGKDGGRDGTFEGTAQKYPSTSSPAKGKFVIQAKHTAEPYASVEDSSFKTLWKKELTKVQSLTQSGECDVYLLFTNRRCTAKQKTDLKATIRAVGVKKCEVFCRDTITLHLQANSNLVSVCGLDKPKHPFNIQPEELSLVIQDFHKALSKNGSGDSLHDFDYVALEQKNRINHLGSDYFSEYIKTDSMPLFSQIRSFLENPRNTELRDQYHATCDEIKGKLLASQTRFSRFEEAFFFLYDILTAQSPTLKSKRKLVNVFLHYMYCDCDIGKKNA